MLARWQHTCSDTGYSELLTFEGKPNYKAIPRQVLTDLSKLVANHYKSISGFEYYCIAGNFDGANYCIND